MIIKRVLNNNAVVSCNDAGEEIILKGKGIAFKKSAGDIIDKSQIEQTFVASDQKINRAYQDILIHIPDDCITTCDMAISLIKRKINKQLSDKIYITLTDHIMNLLERIQMGITFDNALLWDVKRSYKEEYQVSCEVVELLRKAFHVNIPKDEASFITLHIVNAQLDTNFDKVIEMTSLIEDVCDIIRSRFNISDDEENIDFNRFVLHLRFFFERMINKESMSQEKNIELLDIITKAYPKQYSCVMDITKYVGSRYHEPMDGEILYLMVHLVKLTS